MFELENILGHSNGLCVFTQAIAVIMLGVQNMIELYEWNVAIFNACVTLLRLTCCVCVYVCLSVCLCVYVSCVCKLCLSVCVYVSCVCLSVCMCLCLSVCVCVSCVCLSVCLSVCMCLCLSVCVCVSCVCLCVCQLWLQSYKTLFSAPCHKCSRLLVDNLPPTWRDFQSLEAYHEQCRP